MQLRFFSKNTLFKYRIILCLFALLVLMTSVAAAASKPDKNPFLSSPLYGITHFDSSQSDSMPYGPPRGTFNVNPSVQPISYGGPVNIITLASTDPDYMWASGHNRVSYLYVANGEWKEVARYNVVEKMNHLDPLPDENFRKLGESSAVGMTVDTMDAYLKNEILVPNEYYNMGNGGYSVVDNDNVLYTNFGANIYAFELEDPENPSKGIVVKHYIENVVEKILGPGATLHLWGLAMTYDGHLVVTLRNGIAVIDRELKLDSGGTKESCIFGGLKDDAVSNSIAIDEKGGIYVASNTKMRKLVWTEGKISSNNIDGAWEYEYSTDKTDNTIPPIVKFDYGTGSTPTLMGFGDDQDKLVVITSGGKQMKLMAFWRDKMPEGTSQIAHQIPVTCGLNADPERWIQSEQSVVVSGYGAFVVNNMPATVAKDLKDLADGLMPIPRKSVLQVSLMGPAYPGPLGVERFEWNPVTHEWKSVWTRPDVASNSMVPAHSQSASIALVNGYYKGSGWEVTGLDWDTGKTVHRTIFGHKNLGNGAYAIIQYLADKSLVFNSLVGPYRVDYKKLDSGSGGGCSSTGTAASAILLIVPLVLALRGRKR